MLNTVAWASATSAMTVIVYFVFVLLSLISPDLFKFVFNAQFLGANISYFYPQQFNFMSTVASLIVVAIVSWLTGFIWALLYNKFMKKEVPKLDF